MLARSLAVLALLAVAVVAADFKFETWLQEGQSPGNANEHLGNFVIPDGQCSGELDMAAMYKDKEPCNGKGVVGAGGIRTLKAIVGDNAPIPTIEFYSNNIYGRPNEIVVERKGDCKGRAVVQVYYECEILVPPDSTPIQGKHAIGAQDKMPMLKPAKGGNRRHNSPGEQNLC